MTQPALSVTLDGVSIVSSTIAGGTITYGRQNITSQPQPAGLSLSIITPAAPWTFRVGSRIVVKANTITRFDGLVTNIAAGKYTTQLVAVSIGLGTMARGTIPPTTFPAGGPGTFISQIIAAVNAAGGTFTVTTGSIDVGTVEIVAGQTASGNALAAAQTIAAWEPFGVLWETPAGVVNFYDSERRDDISADITLAAAGIVEDWRAIQSMSSVVNSADVTWSGGTESSENLASIAAYGVFSRQETIPYSAAVYAATRAARTVANSNAPAFTTQPVRVPLPLLSGTQTTNILNLKMNDVVAFSGVSVPGLASSMFVEGWTETFSEKTYDFSFYLSDVRLTRPPQQWQDVVGTLRWNAVPGTRTWAELITAYL